MLKMKISRLFVIFCLFAAMLSSCLQPVKRPADTETVKTGPEESRIPSKPEGTTDGQASAPWPEGGLIYDDLNYRVGYRTNPDSKSQFMVISDGENELLIPCGGNGHILAFAYRNKGGAMLVSVLQESFHAEEENGEEVTVYQMSVASYYGLQYYPDIGWSSAMTGVYPDNKSMTDAAAAKNGHKMLMTIEAGDAALRNAREGTSFIILVDYDFMRSDSENRLIVSSDAAPGMFDWHTGREIGAINFSPSYSSAN